MPAPPSATAAAQVPLRDAALAWLAGWFGGSILSTIVFQSSGYESLADTPAAWVLAAQLALWAPLVAATWWVGSRHGSGDLRRDFSLRFRPIDLIGVPIGVVFQLAVIPLLYWPLDQAWPATFSREQLEKPARELWSGAQGFGVVLILLVAVVGAPLVEELVYRGLLQQTFVRCTGFISGLLLVSVWFAAIHFQPAQLLGLFAVGLAFGVCGQRTGRLGLPILMHLAFNATGIAVIAG